MCMLLYIASEVALRTIPWNESSPSFHVDTLRESTGSAAVVHHFSKRHVYVVGSAEKCACAFEANLDREPHELSDREVAVEALRQYLSEAAVHSPIELYACWAGDEALPPQHRRPLHTESAPKSAFSFVPRTFLHVPRRSAA